MGSFQSSKIVKARKAHQCHRCGAQISQGTRYLNYKLGMYYSLHLCLSCAVPTPEVRTKGGGFEYNCADVLKEFRTLYPEAAAAAHLL